jgi:hypothetical protein
MDERTLDVLKALDFDMRTDPVDQVYICHGFILFWSHRFVLFWSRGFILF